MPARGVDAKSDSARSSRRADRVGRAADYDEATAGYAITHDPVVCESIWYQRCKLRDDGAVYRARIMTFIAGTEAETELLGSSQGGDNDDLYQIELMAERIERCNLERLRRMARMLVRRHRGRIERVAAALLAEQDLSGERLDELVGRSVADVPDRLVTGSEAVCMGSRVARAAAFRAARLEGEAPF
jgi:hypothetical protein